MDSFPEQSSTPELAPATSPLPPSEQDPPAQPSAARRLFFGPYGLRAGWSLLIYFAIAAALVFTVRGIQHYTQAPHGHTASAAKAAAPKPDASTPAPLKGIILAESIAFLAFFLLSWLMAAIERRKVSHFGLGGTHTVSRFLVGSVFGLVAQSALIAILYFDHLLVFDARLDFGLAILKWGALQLFAFFLVGLVEEYVFRGYIQFTLTRGLVGLGKLISATHARAIAFWIAAVITSAIFYFAHTGNPGETKIGLFQVFLAGLLLIVCLWRTGSLWLAIGFHMTWDWAQSFLYGVPDSGGLEQGRLFATHAIGNPHLSGGTDGPEGSLFGVVVLLLAIGVIFFVSPSPQPPLETKHKPTPLPPEPPPTEYARLIDPPASA
jgi:membrane protease YdiL (CAAX protease family)